VVVFYNHGDFLKADYLKMLSVLGPYGIDNRINNEYGPTGRIKIGRRNMERTYPAPLCVGQNGTVAGFSNYFSLLCKFSFHW
jgi:hypothetical protein